LVQWVNRIRTVLFAMTVWATFCSGIIATWIMDDQNSSLPAILLLIIWGIMLILFLLFFLFWGNIKSILITHIFNKDLEQQPTTTTTSQNEKVTTTTAS